MSESDTIPAENHPPDSNPSNETPRSTTSVVLAVLKITFIASVAFALCECVAAGAVTLGLYGRAPLPWGILLAALGKGIVTHVLAWCPIALLLALIASRLLRWRPVVPEATACAGVILLGGWLIAPFDLKLAERATTTRVVVLAVVAVFLAFGVYGLTRVLARRAPRFLKRVININFGVDLIIALVCGAVFIVSPLFNPGSFRVASARAAKPASQAEAATANVTLEYPNVLWIVLDTVRSDHMSVYGYDQDTTPNLAKFAEHAIVFERAVSNGIWTLPSHVSMFTGKNVREHGAGHRYPFLNDTFKTIAEALSDHGYTTAAFSNNPWVAPDTHVTRGFDSARVVYHLRHVNRSSLGAIVEALGWSPPVPWLDEDFGAAITNRLIDQWLDEQSDRTQPTFLFVNYMDAHLPYRVPRAYRSEFMTDEQVARSYALSTSVYGSITHAVDREFNFDSPDFLAMSDRDILKRQYDAGIRYTDERVGELLAMCEARGLLENTLVVIVSDHGEYLDTHGMWAHRMQAYQDVLGITIMLRPPGGTSPQRIRTPVQLSDLFGTVLGATVGVGDREIAWHARDLLTLADANNATSNGQRIAVSEYGGPAPENLTRIEAGGNPEIIRRTIAQITAQDERYKLIASADGQQELYDLATDPGELHNLLIDEPDIVARLAAYLATWHERSIRFVPDDTDATGALDPDVIRALKSLGYLGDDE